MEAGRIDEQGSENLDFCVDRCELLSNLLGESFIGQVGDYLYCCLESQEEFEKLLDKFCQATGEKYVVWYKPKNWFRGNVCDIKDEKVYTQYVNGRDSSCQLVVPPNKYVFRKFPEFWRAECAKGPDRRSLRKEREEAQARFEDTV